MAVSADVYVFDNTVSPAPISGVVVGIFDESTFVQVAQATTNSAGKASFMLPGATSPGTTYEVRLFKLGVRFANPFQIAVIDPPVTTNKFDVSGTLLTLSAATDPRRCRCTGRFLNFSNAPVVGATLRFMAKADSGQQVPKVVDGNIISAESMALQTDSDGYVVVDLLRTGEYYATFSGEDDVVWNFKVPDRASVNLIDLIHPAPVALTWDQTDAPSNAFSISVNSSIIGTVHYSMLFNDYQTRTVDLIKYLDAVNSDSTVVEVALRDGALAIRPIMAGTATVTVSAKPGVQPIRVPDNSIAANVLTITITP